MRLSLGTPRAGKAPVAANPKPSRAFETGDYPQMQFTMTSTFRSGASGPRPDDPSQRASTVPRQVTPPGGPEAGAPSGSRRGRAFRSLVLGYSDEESGDQIVIDVRGSGSFPRAAFLAGIERSGFTVLAEDGPGPEGVTSREAAG